MLNHEYLSSDKKLDLYHTICNKKFERSWSHIIRSAACPYCKKTESMHAIILKQVWRYEHPDTICEDPSCVNPKTNRVLPTDIVNHRLKISIEIQSEYHDNEYKQETDKIKKEFWLNKNYDFYAIDIRDYTPLEMINLFFTYDKIPSYIDWHYSDTLDCIKLQKYIDKGHSLPEIAMIMDEPYSKLSNAIVSGRVSDRQAKYPGKKILQFNFDGKLIDEYISKAAIVKKNVNMKNYQIEMAINGEKPDAYNYIWIEKEIYDEEKIDIIAYHNLLIERYEKHKESIVHLPTNNISVLCRTESGLINKFSSQREAANWCNLSYTYGISKCIKGETEYSGRHPVTKEKLYWEKC